MTTPTLVRKKVLNFFYASLMLSTFMLLTSSCDKDEPNPSVEPESITQQFTSSSEGGTLCCNNGYQLQFMPGAIPFLTDGNEATVTFSIETGGDLPQPLPQGVELIGNVIAHYGPEGFIFELPMTAKLQVPDEYNSNEISVAYFDDESNGWKIIPISYVDDQEQIVGIDILQLDYVALVRVPELNSKTNEDRFSGGILFNSSTNASAPHMPPGWNYFDTYNTLTVKSVIPKYAEQMDYFSRFDTWSATTPSITTGGSPNHNLGIQWYLAQGEYEIWITASRVVGFGSTPEIYTYSLPATVDIDEAVHCNGFSTSSCNGWNYLTIPGGGQWIEGRPDSWPATTVPVCTGEFQATLTWYNGTSGDTDLDLHLYGPDSLHVWYSNTNPGIGGLFLDRDWISDPGNAQENICAPTLSDMPRGDYRLTVVHYSGLDNKAYQVRLIQGDKSTNYAGTLSSNGEDTIVEFTLN